MERYEEALEIFKHRRGKNSKEVAQLTMWMVVALMWLGKFPEAKDLNEKATTLVKKVFGEESWEGHRALLDKVYILQHEFDKESEAQASEVRAPDEDAPQLMLRMLMLDDAHQ